MPGWCGNFWLTSAEVRAALPRVERALTFDAGERAAAEALGRLEYLPEEETVLDGPLRLWRLAAESGAGLCGVCLVIH